ncbi:unnamed protein product [Hydatigera taeniaeformis]|uniref:BRCT domain-containing protein n=1 Tax=Hydatigena taeniaeformis TaxID=6205 RepID=A0A0R3X371_HYDTA|nr:unnamed protein product [Hydatigera taeniaeformis]
MLPSKSLEASVFVDEEWPGQNHELPTQLNSGLLFVCGFNNFSVNEVKSGSVNWGPLVERPESPQLSVISEAPTDESVLEKQRYLDANFQESPQDHSESEEPDEDDSEEEADRTIRETLPSEVKEKEGELALPLRISSISTTDSVNDPNDEEELCHRKAEDSVREGVAVEIHEGGKMPLQTTEKDTNVLNTKTQIPEEDGCSEETASSEVRNDDSLKSSPTTEMQAVEEGGLLISKQVHRELNVIVDDKPSEERNATNEGRNKSVEEERDDYPTKLGGSRKNDEMSELISTAKTIKLKKKVRKLRQKNYSKNQLTKADETSSPLCGMHESVRPEGSAATANDFLAIGREAPASDAQIKSKDPSNKFQSTGDFERGSSMEPLGEIKKLNEWKSGGAVSESDVLSDYLQVNLFHTGGVDSEFTHNGLLEYVLQSDDEVKQEGNAKTELKNAAQVEEDKNDTKTLEFCEQKGEKAGKVVWNGSQRVPVLLSDESCPSEMHQHSFGENLELNNEKASLKDPHSDVLEDAEAGHVILGKRDPVEGSEKIKAERDKEVESTQDIQDSNNFISILKKYTSQDPEHSPGATNNSSKNGLQRNVVSATKKSRKKNKRNRGGRDFGGEIGGEEVTSSLNSPINEQAHVEQQQQCVDEGDVNLLVLKECLPDHQEDNCISTSRKFGTESEEAEQNDNGGTINPDKSQKLKKADQEEETHKSDHFEGEMDLEEATDELRLHWEKDNLTESATKSQSPQNHHVEGKDTMDENHQPETLPKVVSPLKVYQTYFLKNEKNKHRKKRDSISGTECEDRPAFSVPTSQETSNAESEVDPKPSEPTADVGSLAQSEEGRDIVHFPSTDQVCAPEGEQPSTTVLEEPTDHWKNELRMRECEVHGQGESVSECMSGVAVEDLQRSGEFEGCLKENEKEEGDEGREEEGDDEVHPRADDDDLREGLREEGEVGEESAEGGDTLDEIGESGTRRSAGVMSSGEESEVLAMKCGLKKESRKERHFISDAVVVADAEYPRQPEKANDTLSSVDDLHEFVSEVEDQHANGLDEISCPDEEELAMDRSTHQPDYELPTSMHLGVTGAVERLSETKDYLSKDGDVESIAGDLQLQMRTSGITNLPSSGILEAPSLKVRKKPKKHRKSRSHLDNAETQELDNPTVPLETVVTSTGEKTEFQQESVFGLLNENSNPSQQGIPIKEPSGCLNDSSEISDYKLDVKGECVEEAEVIDKSSDRISIRECNETLAEVIEEVCRERSGEQTHEGVGAEIQPHISRETLKMSGNEGGGALGNPMEGANDVDKVVKLEDQHNFGASGFSKPEELSTRSGRKKRHRKEEHRQEQGEIQTPETNAYAEHLVEFEDRTNPEGNAVDDEGLAPGDLEEAPQPSECDAVSPMEEENHFTTHKMEVQSVLMNDTKVHLTEMNKKTSDNKEWMHRPIECAGDEMKPLKSKDVSEGCTDEVNAESYTRLTEGVGGGVEIVECETNRDLETSSPLEEQETPWMERKGKKKHRKSKKMVSEAEMVAEGRNELDASPVGQGIVSELNSHSTVATGECSQQKEEEHAMKKPFGYLEDEPVLSDSNLGVRRELVDYFKDISEPEEVVHRNELHLHPSHQLNDQREEEGEGEHRPDESDLEGSGNAKEVKTGKELLGRIGGESEDFHEESAKGGGNVDEMIEARTLHDADIFPPLRESEGTSVGIWVPNPHHNEARVQSPKTFAAPLSRKVFSMNNIEPVRRLDGESQCSLEQLEETSQSKDQEFVVNESLGPVEDGPQNSDDILTVQGECAVKSEFLTEAGECGTQATKQYEEEHLQNEDAVKEVVYEEHRKARSDNLKVVSTDGHGTMDEIDESESLQVDHNVTILEETEAPSEKCGRKKKQRKGRRFASEVECEDCHASFVPTSQETSNAESEVDPKPSEPTADVGSLAQSEEEGGDDEVHPRADDDDLREGLREEGEVGEESAEGGDTLDEIGESGTIRSAGVMSSGEESAAHEPFISVGAVDAKLDKRAAGVEYPAKTEEIEAPSDLNTDALKEIVQEMDEIQEGGGVDFTFNVQLTSDEGVNTHSKFEESLELNNSESLQDRTVECDKNLLPSQVRWNGQEEFVQTKSVGLRDSSNENVESGGDASHPGLEIGKVRLVRENKKSNLWRRRFVEEERPEIPSNEKASISLGDADSGSMAGDTSQILNLATSEGLTATVKSTHLPDVSSSSKVDYFFSPRRDPFPNLDEDFSQSDETMTSAEGERDTDSKIIWQEMPMSSSICKPFKEGASQLTPSSEISKNSEKEDRKGKEKSLECGEPVQVIDAETGECHSSEKPNKTMPPPLLQESEADSAKSRKKRKHQKEHYTANTHVVEEDAELPLSGVEAEKCMNDKGVLKIGHFPIASTLSTSKGTGEGFAEGIDEATTRVAPPNLEGRTLVHQVEMESRNEPTAESYMDRMSEGGMESGQEAHDLGLNSELQIAEVGEHLAEGVLKQNEYRKEVERLGRPASTTQETVHLGRNEDVRSQCSLEEESLNEMKVSVIAETSGNNKKEVKLNEFSELERQTSINVGGHKAQKGPQIKEAEDMIGSSTEEGEISLEESHGLEKPDSYQNSEEFDGNSIGVDSKIHEPNLGPNLVKEGTSATLVEEYSYSAETISAKDGEVSPQPANEADSMEGLFDSKGFEASPDQAASQKPPEGEIQMNEDHQRIECTVLGDPIPTEIGLGDDSLKWMEEKEQPALPRFSDPASDGSTITSAKEGSAQIDSVYDLEVLKSNPICADVPISQELGDKSVESERCKKKHWRKEHSTKGTEECPTPGVEEGAPPECVKSVVETNISMDANKSQAFVTDEDLLKENMLQQKVELVKNTCSGFDTHSKVNEILSKDDIQDSEARIHGPVIGIKTEDASLVKANKQRGRKGKTTKAERLSKKDHNRQCWPINLQDMEIEAAGATRTSPQPFSVGTTAEGTQSETMSPLREEDIPSLVSGAEGIQSPDLMASLYSPSSSKTPAEQELRIGTNVEIGQQVEIENAEEFEVEANEGQITSVGPSLTLTDQPLSDTDEMDDFTVVVKASPPRTIIEAEASESFKFPNLFQAPAEPIIMPSKSLQIRLKRRRWRWPGLIFLLLLFLLFFLIPTIIFFCVAAPDFCFLPGSCPGLTLRQRINAYINEYHRQRMSPFPT